MQPAGYGAPFPSEPHPFPSERLLKCRQRLRAAQPPFCFCEVRTSSSAADYGVEKPEVKVSGGLYVPYDIVVPGSGCLSALMHRELAKEDCADGQRQARPRQQGVAGGRRRGSIG